MTEHTETTPTPTPRGYWTTGRVVIAIGALLVAFVLGAFAGGAGSSRSNATAPSAQTTTADTAPASPAPAPTPLALSGTGSKVVGFDLPQGSYKLAWTAQGHDNFIVRLEGAESSGLVNEIPPDPSSGETFVRLGGGHYNLNVKASTLTWSVTFTAA
jgi:hypothetical protein